MVANGISYPITYMNAIRISTGRSVQQNMYDIAFDHLVEQLEVSLFEEKRRFLIKSARDQYRAVLLELGDKTADINCSITLKWKLQKRLGKRISYSP